MFYLYIILLLAITYQDIKERKIYLLNVLALILVGGAIFLYKVLPFIFLINISINLLLVLILLLILVLYCKIKLKMSLLKALGGGDILLFLALAISFPTSFFLIIFSLSLIFSALVFSVIKNKLEDKRVPLAGLQALFLAIVLIINNIFGFVNVYAL